MNKTARQGLALLALSVSSALTVALADDRKEGPPTRYFARLQPVQEVPAVSSIAAGRISVVIDDAAQTITYELDFSDLEGTIAQGHIHTAQAGVNGGIMVWLCGTTALPGPVGTPVCPTTGTLTGLLTPLQVVGPAAQGISPGEFAEVVAAIRSGVAYANVHSSKFPGGEIRGQIRRLTRFDRKDD